MHAIATAVADRVRAQLRSEESDPRRDPARAHDLALAAVRAHNDVAAARGLPLVEDESACVRTVIAAVAGYGPLQPYLDDPAIEEGTTL
ncbi:hypothetical protein [Microbacterium gorillae]|uniref:hypothetical protein n=1 Tax=Microbacterium gorillae TaxID=1231063 RepID=UPI0011416755|nr:hypothetical protein [Microbacterium gorillae]